MDLDDIGFGKTKVVFDEIECIMSVDEDEHQLMQNCSAVDKIMELDHVMKGNDDFVVDSSEIPCVIVGKDTCLDIHSLGESRMDSEQTILHPISYQLERKPGADQPYVLVTRKELLVDMVMAFENFERTNVLTRADAYKILKSRGVKHVRRYID
ncbi:hypothetical protein LINPERHAP1_LOCUS22775, partial [Linum perenne]